VAQRVTIRTLRPTDALAFLAFRKLAPRNEALGDDRGTRSAPTLEAVVNATLTLDPRRGSVAILRNRDIVGLASARPRFGTDTWDIDKLMAGPETDAAPVYLALIEALCGRAVAEGVEKLYLRVHENSDAVAPARQAGLFAYARESVRVALAEAAVPPTDLLDDIALAGLRPRQPVDHQALFQLYSSLVPLAVRQVEAMTLREWRWLDGWGGPGAALQSRGRRRQDYVVAREGAIHGWIRIYPATRRVEVLCGGRDSDLARSLVAFGRARLGGGEPVILPLRDYQSALAPIVEEIGFSIAVRNWLLVRVFTLRATEGRLVPIGAS
jgi:hypothetical protein